MAHLLSTLLSWSLLLTIACSMPILPSSLSIADQQPLGDFRHPLLPSFRKPLGSVDGPRFDPAPNTVGLYFEQTKDSSARSTESIHVWLPLERRVQVREHPFLPSHPAQARIMAVVMDGTKDQHLDTTTCTIYPDNTGKYWREQREPVTFRASDGLVDLEEPSKAWYLDRTQVESYECS